jgi:hypothetical protein
MSQSQSEFVKGDVQRLTLYPIAGVAGPWEDEPFDESKLPAPIASDVTVENVTPLFSRDAWSFAENQVGKRDLETLKRVKHAIVHRYFSGRYGTGISEQESADLVHNLAACLRLIRPMRQYALVINGSLQPDDTISIQSFDHPSNSLKSPTSKKDFLFGTEMLRSCSLSLRPF